MAKWKVLLTDTVREWLAKLAVDDAETAMLVRAAIRVLGDDGPALGRPLVDTIKGSRIKNMKELRPGSSGRSEIRILFAFDPRRHAVLLVAEQKIRAPTGRDGTGPRSSRLRPSTTST